MQKFIIASNNEHKVKEFQNMLKPFGIKVVSYKSVLKEELEIEETGKTFRDNAKIKAEAICERTGLPTFADDSGFCIKDLHYFPGVRSSRFAEEIGGYDKAFEEIHKRLQGKVSDACFVCVIAFARPEEKTVCFEGICNGFTVFPPRGNDGFAYDPIFVPNSFGMTFAEMTAEQKNAISHRSVACSLFLKFIDELKKEDALKPKVRAQENPFMAGNVNSDVVSGDDVAVEEKVEQNDDVFDVEVDEKFNHSDV